MWTYHPDLLARPVPRYTSYPTAADFHDRIGSSDLELALAAVRLCDQLSLYVHIPFCEQICWYCGCNTARANRAERMDGYIDALCAEIDLVAARLEDRGRVRRIAFGGGSPNALSVGQFRRLFAHLDQYFHLDEPIISIELDPRGFTAEWRDLIAEIGMHNVSLGVQSFEPEVQAAIGRIQPRDLITDMVTDLRQAGVQSLNFDLMYGLPGQTTDILLHTLEQTLALEPDRIALFGYAHIPALIPRQRQIDDQALPDAHSRFDMAALGHDFLTLSGYAPVGFDHFALPDDPLGRSVADGTLRRNFQGFTDDSSSILIGLGASAISEFPDLIVQNAKHTAAYRTAIASSQLPTERGIRPTRANKIHGGIIEQLLTQGSAELEPLSQRDHYLAALAPFVDRNLIGMEGTKLSLHPAGLPYARTIAAIFDEFRGEMTGTFSKAV